MYLSSDIIILVLKYWTFNSDYNTAIMCNYRKITNLQIQHFPKTNLLDEIQLCTILSIYFITLILYSNNY